MVMTPPLPHSAPAALPPPGAERSTAAWLGRPDGGWRLRLYTVIFESDTPLGRLFDKVLIGIILLSIVVVVLRATHKDTTEQQIIDWCRENMAVYKVPRIVQLVPALPKSGSGKVMWRALQESELAAEAKA